MTDKPSSPPSSLEALLSADRPRRWWQRTTVWLGVVGLLALAWASFIPKTYESTAILKAEQTTASLMLSAAVLDPIAANLGYTPKQEQDEARDKLKSQIKANVNAKDKLLTLTAQANSPQAAQIVL